MRLINITTNIRKRRNRTQNISNRALYDIQIFLWAAVREKKRRVCVWDDRDRWGNTHTSQVGWKFQPRSKTKKSGCKEQKNIYIYKTSNKSYTITTAKKGRCRRIGNSTNPSCALGGPNISLSLSFFCVFERDGENVATVQIDKRKKEEKLDFYDTNKNVFSPSVVCAISAGVGPFRRVVNEI